MRKLINSRIMLISLIAILLGAVLYTFSYYRVFQREVMADLRVSTKLLAETEDPADGRSLSRFAQELAGENIRITLIRPDGSVAFDNVAQAESLENHRNRKEIRNAFATGEGSSVRLSDTIHRSTFYYALRLEDGNILRMARESRSLYGMFINAFLMAGGLSLILLVMCYPISRLLTRSILRPIGDMVSRMDSPREDGSEPAYPELEPVLQRIRDQHRDILQSARLRQEFTANVSHELKTPLTSISGYSELIENGMATEADTRKFAGEIHRNADRLLTLINDIIRLSELDTTMPDSFTEEPVNLFEVANTCALMLEPVCEKHGVTMQVDGEASIVRANRTMAEELVYNLCDNAIRYNREGGSVHISVRDRTLIVADNGIGIAAEHLDRIFERFYRVDKSRSKKTGGTGLGLAIVKHIADLHGADIRIRSREGEGTAVTVVFPA